MKKGFNSLIRFTGVSLLTLFLGTALKAQTPIANPDFLDPVSTDVENISFNPLLNDVFSNVGNMEVIIISGPTNGSADTSFSSSTNSFSINYAPDLAPQFEGIDTLTYVLCDTSGGQIGVCDTAEVQFRRGTFPSFPVTVVDSFYVGQNLSADAVIKDFNVVSNDTLTMFNNMEVSIVTAPSLGVATIDLETQTIDYLPNLNEFGFDSVSYSYCDTFNYQQKNPFHPDGYYCDTVKSYIYINQLHKGGNESGDTVKMGISTVPFKTQNYLLNDEDLDNDTLSVRGLTFTASGSITNSASDSTFLYTPDVLLSEPGMPIYTDTVVYDVCDSLVNKNIGSPQNLEQCVSDTMLIVVVPEPFDSLPVVESVVVRDTILFGETGTISISARDPEGSGLDDIIIGIESVEITNVVSDANGVSFSYTVLPTQQRSAIDTFLVKVCEASVGALDETRCTDVQIITFLMDTLPAPIAVNDSVTVNEEGEISIDLFDNDVLNGSTLLSLEEPQFGSLTLDTASGVIDYISFKDEPGTEILKYVICRDSCDSAFVVINIIPEYIPLVIEGVSPNNDGVNDQLTIKDVDYDLHQVSVKIFNRWGNIIFEEENYDDRNPDKSWRGQSNQGGSVVDGTYFYLVEIPELDFVKSGDLLFISNK